MLGETAAGRLGGGVEALELEQLPVPQDRHQDLVAMDAEVIDAGLRDLRRLPDEPGDPGAGHLEREDLVDDRPDRGRWVELERRREHVPVEDHVEVLVGRDANHDLVRDGIGRVLPGVPM